VQFCPLPSCISDAEITCDIRVPLNESVLLPCALLFSSVCCCLQMSRESVKMELLADVALLPGEERIIGESCLLCVCVCVCVDKGCYCSESAVIFVVFLYDCLR